MGNYLGLSDQRVVNKSDLKIYIRTKDQQGYYIRSLAPECTLLFNHIEDLVFLSSNDIDYHPVNFHWKPGHYHLDDLIVEVITGESTIKVFKKHRSEL
jgi:hypothetical protein